MQLQARQRAAAVLKSAEGGTSIWSTLAHRCFQFAARWQPRQSGLGRGSRRVISCSCRRLRIQFQAVPRSIWAQLGTGDCWKASLVSMLSYHNYCCDRRVYMRAWCIVCNSSASAGCLCWYHSRSLLKTTTTLPCSSGLLATTARATYERSEHDNKHRTNGDSWKVVPVGHRHACACLTSFTLN